MKLLLLESKRIYKRIWLLFLFVTLLLLGLWISSLSLTQKYAAQGATPEDYQSITNQYSGMPLDQAKITILQDKETVDLLTNTLLQYRLGLVSADELKQVMNNNKFHELSITESDFAKLDSLRCSYTMLFEEIEILSSYEDFLAKIQQGSFGLSGIDFFSKDSYVLRTAEKSKADYSHLDVKMDFFYANVALKEFFQSRLVDLFIFLFLTTIVLLLFLEESDKGYLSLTSTMKLGTHTFFFIKLLILFLSVFFTVLIFYGSQFLLFRYKFGPCIFDAPIQSIAIFSSCNHNWSVATTLVLFLFLKGLTFFFLTLVLVLLTSFCKNTLNFLGILFPFLVFLFLGYYSISVTQSELLYYLNPIHILDTAQLLIDYKQIRLFGFPISHKLVTFSVLAASGCLCYYISNILYAVPKKNKISFKTLFHKAKPIFPHKQRRKYFSLFLLETRKLLLTYRLWLPISIFCFLIFLCAFAYNKETLTMEDNFYKEYMQQLNGPLTSEKKQWIKKEENYFSNLESLRNELLSQENPHILLHYIESLMIKRTAFSRVEEKLAYLEKTPTTTSFLYEDGFLILFGIKQSTQAEWLLLLGLLFLSVTTPYCIYIEFQQNAISLTYTFYKGRRSFIRIKYHCLLAFLLFILFNIAVSHLLSVFRTYGFYGINLDLINIPQMQGPFEHLTVGTYLILILMIQLLGFALMLAFSMAVSYLSRDFLKSVIWNIIFFIVPYILMLNGFSVFDNYLFNTLSKGTSLLLLIQGKDYVSLILLAVQLLITIVIILNFYKKYKEGDLWTVKQR